MSSHDNAAAEQFILRVHRGESLALIDRDKSFEDDAPLAVQFL
jgi:hypothetical protein